MSSIEILKEIIRQKGDCKGISCGDDKCPLGNKFGNDLCCCIEDNLKLAKEMLSEEKREVNKFKIGSEVKWNGKTDSKSLRFYNNMEDFLKSKEIHTIRDICNNEICRLEGFDYWLILNWFDLVEGENNE